MVGALLIQSLRSPTSAARINVPDRVSVTAGRRNTPRIADCLGRSTHDAPVGFEAIDRTLKDITRSNSVFGGKVRVAWRRLTSDLASDTPRQPSADCECMHLSTPVWQHVRVMRLTLNMRAAQDVSRGAFSHFLLRVGEGQERRFQKEFRVLRPGSAADAVTTWLRPRSASAADLRCI